MTHNRYAGFFDEHNRGYLVAFDLHWHVIDAKRVDPHVGASQALVAFIAGFEMQGWQCEGAPTYGFVFMNRGCDRILIEATPRDPRDDTFQSFNPFKLD